MLADKPARHAARSCQDGQKVRFQADDAGEEEAAEQVFDSIVANVRGNRSQGQMITASDYGAIMDRIAALHIRTRHGEDAVSESAAP